MHDVLLERAAQRDLKGLPAAEFARVVARIRGLVGNPRPPGSRKLRGSQSDWRLRIGDYRVIYEIDDGAKVVRVMRVRHRSEAYR